MSYIIRSVEEKDLRDIYALASQFSLLNLPPDEEILEAKIKKSLKSFRREVKDPTEAEYFFVVEDLDRKQVVASSLILAKHGTEDSPHISFEVRREERFSRDLGIGFIHQVLSLKQSTNGPTEVGGLLVDRSYRRVPEKLGRQISLIRFLYIALHQDLFEDRVLCEFAPPLTREGRSEFWEALGRRFTGLSYQEADQISQKHKEFIQTLFPEGDIYLCLLDTQARQVLGQVGEPTRPAQFFLESLGFRYLNEVDPFDGGPHYGCKTKEITIVQKTKRGQIKKSTRTGYGQTGLVCTEAKGGFRAVQTAFEADGSALYLPEASFQALLLKDGDEVAYCSYT